MQLSLSFALRFFLSTRLLSRGRGAFSFPAFFNRREFGIVKRRGEGRGKVNLSRRVSRLVSRMLENARLGRNLGERDLISRIKNSNNSGGGRSEFHAALRPRVSPGIRKSSAAVTAYGILWFSFRRRAVLCIDDKSYERFFVLCGATVFNHLIVARRKRSRLSPRHL